MVRGAADRDLSARIPFRIGTGSEQQSQSLLRWQNPGEDAKSAGATRQALEHSRPSCSKGAARFPSGSHLPSSCNTPSPHLSSEESASTRVRAWPTRLPPSSKRRLNANASIHNATFPLPTGQAPRVRSLSCCKQALAQACAVCSPFSESMRCSTSLSKVLYPVSLPC